MIPTHENPFSLSQYSGFTDPRSFNSQRKWQFRTASQKVVRPGASTWLDGGAGRCSSQEWPNVLSHDSMPESTQDLIF